MIRYYEVYSTELEYSNYPFKQEFKSNPYCRVITYWINDKIVGYLLYSDIYERIELDQIEVTEAYRHQNIATELMQEFVTIARKQKKKNITLEVKENNEIAIHLYQKFGFKSIAIRKQYYQGMDGILMELTL